MVRLYEILMGDDRLDETASQARSHDFAKPSRQDVSYVEVEPLCR